MRLLLLTTVLLSGLAFAHGGGTNAQGCHSNAKTGQYHCHGSKAAQKQSESTQGGYNRKDWPHWIDEDSDCQNTRNEILIVYSRIAPSFKTSRGCDVVAGEWFDPYSGNTYQDDQELDIDHIVPLGHAHEMGGYAWSRDRRQAFANDPDNLLAVSKRLNRQKGKKGPAEWMPPNTAYHCDYIVRWQFVKYKYGLAATEREQTLVQEYQSACAEN